MIQRGKTRGFGKPVDRFRRHGFPCWWAFLVLAGRLGAVDFVNDGALEGRLQSHLERYAETSGHVSVTALQAGLGRQVTEAPIRLARPATRSRSWDEIHERVRKSVVILGQLYRCPSCHKNHVSVATGFLIAADGVLVTNDHVVREDRGGVLGALTADGQFHPVIEILATSQREDVAVLRLQGGGFQPLPVVADKPVGSAVGVLSHPKSAFYSFTAGIISRYALEGPTGSRRETRHALVITADYAKGSSGAPVLDACGNVVGIASSTESIYYNEDHGRQENLQQVVKICVPSRSLLELIQDGSNADRSGTKR